MFAIVRLGNQQFKVQAGDFVRVALLKSSKETIQLPVLALEDKSGFLLDASELKTVKVTAKVLRKGLSKKVLVLKKKRRKGYRKTRGHRQNFTELQILEIASGSNKSSVSSAKIVSPKKSEVQKVDVKEKKKTKTMKTATKKVVTKKSGTKATSKKTVAKKTKTSTKK